MASVTSLDQDMRNLRLSRYTPAAANEARAWIEDVLGRPLASGDLLNALKDGVALCELVNLVLPSPGIKFKTSNMPFVQMENISHFLRGCEMPPLSMPAHDRFLTVDLYESKDPAQVMQCLAAFSRQAHAINPSRFASAIGPKKSVVISPTTTGQRGSNVSPTRQQTSNRYSATISPSSALPSTTRALSPSVTGGSTGSQTSNTRSPAPVSTWSKKADVGSTAPAWSIHQYGWTGGADQGKQGISFGARRQITSQSPHVPSLAEKERLRKEKEAEAERQRQIEKNEEQRRRIVAEQEERLAREAEETKWEEETKRHREEERARLAQQKREWEEQERQWRDAEEKRKQEEVSATLPVKRPPEKPRTPSGNVLRGQTLSQYQREQAQVGTEEVETADQLRVRELERQLAEARDREEQYRKEREERLQQQEAQKTSTSIDTTTERPSTAQSEGDLSWTADEREYQRKHVTPSNLSTSIAVEDLLPPDTNEPLSHNLDIDEAQAAQTDAPPSIPVRSSMPDPTVEAVTAPTSAAATMKAPVTSPLARSSQGSTIRSPFTRPANRTDSYLSSNPAPISTTPRISSSTEAGDTAQEQAKLRDDRIASQQKTRAGAWASKSLLEREMERERERQREWEANQATVKDAPRDATQGAGEGQTWDVNTYGWIKGDSQNRGSSSGSGINVGGRRQIIGPRPQP